MRRRHRTTQLLAGAGIAAGTLLGWAGVAQAATPTITSAPPSPGTSRNVTWTFTVPQGGRGGQQTFCALTLGNQRIAGPSPCTTSATYDLTGRPYGTYTFTVSDGFRNGSTATSTYTLVPPPPPTAPTITSAPTSPARSTSPTWSFTVPAGTTAQCSLLNGSTTVSAPATCTSPKSYPLTTDGTYTFRVVAIDNLGQASSPATSAYTLDTTPPATPVITGSPSSPNDAGPTWTFTAAGTTSTCTLTAGGVAVGGPAPCTGSATYDLTTKPAGPYVFSVTTADGLGNTSPAATSTYTYAGLPAPPAPTITSSPTSPGRNTQPTWTFTTKAGTVTTCTVSKGGTTVIAATPCTASFTPNLGPFGDGAYTLSVIAFDGASGLSSAPATRTYTLDTTPPAPPPFTATPAPTSNSATPVWRFSTPAGATSLQCTLTRGGTVISGPSPCTGGSFNPNLRTSGDGTYTLTVVAIDAAGNTSAPSTSSYTYDTTPPPAPAITSAPPSLSNISAPTWTFTTPAGAATQCTLAQGATVISGPGPCSGSFSDPLTGRPDGTYTFTVWAVDGAGNASPTVVSSIVRDTTPPGPPTILTGPAKTTSASSANWTFKAPGSASTQCSITKGTTTAVAVGPVSCGSPSAFDLSTLPSGPYTFNVVAYDAAGNASAPATYPFTWQAPAPPAPAPSPSGSTGSPGSGPRTVTLAPVPITPAPSTITIIAPPAPSLPAPARSTGSNSAGNGAKAKPGAPKATTPGAAGTAEAPATPTTAAPAPVEQIIQTAGKVAGAVSKKAAFPLLLILLMIFFLAIQDQIDRRDPKLADAPVHPTNDLGFDPPPTRRPA